MIADSEETIVTPPAPTVGIIGLGYGRTNIPAFQANGCRVVALCRRDRASAKAIVARLLEGIRTGVTPSPSFEDGVRAQAVLDAVLASASRGTWVEVPPATTG